MCVSGGGPWRSIGGRPGEALSLEWGTVPKLRSETIAWGLDVDDVLQCIGLVLVLRFYCTDTPSLLC